MDADGIADLFWRGVINLIISPFLIARFIFRSIQKDKAKAAETAAVQKASQSREEQIKALDAALMEQVPKSPVAKMRATIRFGELSLPELVSDHHDYGRTLRDSGKLETIYTVDMLVELSEQERALMLEHGLNFIEIENEARFNQEDLDHIEYEGERAIDAIDGINDPLGKEIAKMAAGDATTMAKAKRRLTTLGDLLVVPYRREFKWPHDAKQHADKLKTKLLPQLRTVLDQYKDHKTAETVEF